jgi:hypothetical protein
MFRRLEQRPWGTGSVTPTAHLNAGRPRTLRTPANEDAIISAVERELSISSLDIGGELRVSQTRVLKVFRDDQLHPYHQSRNAHLFPDYQPVRIQICERLRHQHTADEIRLHVERHLWARNNPHYIRGLGYQVHFSVGVWTGIVGDIIVDPYLLHDRFTAQQYRDFLKSILLGLLEDVPPAVKQKVWFQHKETPSHYVEGIRQWLNATYAGRWIQCRGPTERSPRSPDLTQMDCFLWGHL